MLIPYPLFIKYSMSLECVRSVTTVLQIQPPLSSGHTSNGRNLLQLPFKLLLVDYRQLITVPTETLGTT